MTGCYMETFDTAWSKAVPALRIAAVVAASSLLLTPPSAMATEIFLSCRGNQSTEFKDAKPSFEFDAEASVKIDVDKHLFFWDYHLLATTSCLIPKKGLLEE